VIRTRQPSVQQHHNIDVRPIGTLVATIVRTFSPDQVWLFGSRARGDARERSDWDLLVVVPDDTQRELFDPQLAWRLQREMGTYADVVLLTRSEFAEDQDTANSLPYLVAREGALLYER